MHVTKHSASLSTVLCPVIKTVGGTVSYIQVMPIEAYRGVAALPSSVVSAETPKRSFQTPEASESPKGCSDEYDCF